MIFDTSEATFEQDVIERSRTIPVVVDFWAEWCGPCRQLTPVLERLVTEREGKIALAKLDTDANQQISAAFGIQSIPAVKAFKDGQIVDEFVGAQPPQVVREFLSLLAPSEQQLAEEEALKAAAEMLAKGELDAIEPLLAKIDPRGPRFDHVEAIRRMLELAQAARDFGGEDKARAAVAANEGDLEARYALGAALAARGQPREALEQFLEIVSRSRKFREDGGRRAMLILFDLPSTDPELAREFRRRLQIIT